MLKHTIRLVAALAMTAAMSVTALVVTGSAAHADGCYTWGRQLSQGMSGEDVRQLQIRVSGYPGYGAVLGLDGAYGPATAAAVQRFQSAYGLAADGIAGPQTFNQIYALQDNDCTPINFSYAEMNNCNTTWAGGAVSAAQAKFNALVTMWKLQALRKDFGQPLYISSGFRSVACNNAVGGAEGSRHLYGDAADLTGAPSFCAMAQRARYHGFREILGPGYPDHSDHTHVADKPSQFWSAPNCGI
jgi:zinc D-Ala-D-Ala carboxypeptidase